MPFSSTNRSATVPLSFDRFRTRSMEILSPFRNHHCDKDVKQSSERSWRRKTQVHPNNSQSTEFDRTDYDASYLFDAVKPSDSKTSSSSKNSQNKKCVKSVVETHQTSNITRVIDTNRLPVKNVLRPSCPPTPCMIGYRQRSLPTLVPTRIIKCRQASDDAFQLFDVDHFDA